jgi:hypothetical protein
MTTRQIAPPPYISPEQLHGPCFVLDAKLWMMGVRKVVRTILPKRAALKRPRAVIYRPATLTAERRQVVTWPRGRPTQWRLELVATVKPEPLWHTRARALRQQGMSIRRIMGELGLVNRAAVDKVLAGTV